uniref:PH domain-containing protein n=1 Tax=Peronospora matthiolae TaxID=2874970 RepID=A0AAV1T5B6_9STRA
MTTSNTLKLKLGPFRVATSIFLVNVMPFGHRNATCLLRVERPNVCGGRIDVSIGHPDMPIKLLPRSAKDRRKLRFAIRYGMKKGKTIRFCAPNTTVYDHWIAVLCEAFGGSAKAAKRSSTKTDSAIDHDGYNDIDIQEAVITSDDESMRGHCGSFTIDPPDTDYNNTCREHVNVVTDMDTCSSSSSSDISGIYQTPIARSDAPWSVIEKPRGALEHPDVCNEDNTSTDTSTKRQPSLTLASKPVSSTSTDKDDENVYDTATNTCEAALKFTRVPLQDACTTDHGPRMDKACDLSSVEWLHRIIRYLCNGELVSGCFRLTDTSCNRLQPTDVKSAVQSFIMRWLAILQQPLACIGIRLRTCHHDAFCRTCLYLYRRFRC